MGVLFTNGRYGVLAGHSNDRAELVPQPEEDADAEPVEQLCLFELAHDAPLQPPPPPSRHPWAWLLQRVFAVDVMTCPMCEGAMKLVTIATEPGDILDVLGNLPPARAPPLNRQLELDFVAA